MTQRNDGSMNWFVESATCPNGLFQHLGNTAMRTFGVQAFIDAKETGHDYVAGRAGLAQFLAPIGSEISAHGLDAAEPNMLLIYAGAAVGMAETAAKMAGAILLTPAAVLGLNALSAMGIQAIDGLRKPAE